MRDCAENLPSVLQLLHRCGQCVDEMFGLGVGSSDITPRQFAILVAVAQREGINQMDIVDATGVDRSTTSELDSPVLPNSQVGLPERRRRTSARKAL
jgi:MarR family transcriptional regulator, temperature-dependent positive regulator of motility